MESIERNIRNDCTLETGKLANGAVLIATEEMIGKDDAFHIRKLN